MNNLINHGIKINSMDKNVTIIKEWICAFIQEMEFYMVNNNEESGPWRRYAERPLLGLFTTGIARGDSQNSTSILQEFGVYKNHKFLGRCDLFLGVENIAYVIESKYASGRGGNKHWDKDIYAKYLDSIYNQCKNYLEAEISEYKIYKRLFLMVIVFQEISNTNKDKFFEHISKAKGYQPELLNEFYTFITSKDIEHSNKWYSGLEVYGYLKER